MSLKRRLLLLSLVATLTVWLPVNFWFYRNAIREVDQLYDAHLAQSARVLMALAAAGTDQGDLARLGELLSNVPPSDAPTTHEIVKLSGTGGGGLERSIAFQLLRSDGSLELVSADAPGQPFAANVTGFSDRSIGGVRWRVFGLADPNRGFVLYAGEQHAVREALAGHLVKNLLYPAELAAVPFLFLIWLAVGKGLAPLMEVVQKLRTREPQDLRPLSGSMPVPAELEPLVDALDALFGRLERAINAERQFTGNAAHELRTPLAGLRVQAQVAKFASNDKQRDRALEQIIAGVDQAGHLVDQLLTLSRLDFQNGPLEDTSVNLLEVARRTGQGLEPLARECLVSLRIEGAEDAEIRSGETCVAILLRNLFDNAIRYSPPGGKVTVTIARCGVLNELIVDDTGPGIPDGQISQMFHRFHRGSESTRPGSGLGLSIVRRICELHGGSVQLENRKEGGLRCAVRLPSLLSAAENPEADAPMAAPQRRLHGRLESLLEGRSITSIHARAEGERPANL
jgi:two-component system sensor histidine kinase QseC